MVRFSPAPAAFGVWRLAEIADELDQVNEIIHEMYVLTPEDEDGIRGI
jgi:hypothetical protein